MDSETENDPFDLNFSKKIRIKEFLIFMESEEGQDWYIIKKFDRSKEQNLEALKFIQKIIESDPDINSSRLEGYLRQQRLFMKRYLNEVNKKPNND
ncbi:MAG: hypothetical protein KGD74_04830 [Candidatus Lokiarchaeota archaeon]|nr:hypothetical protein [Candidatus Lokiarchaeota archaeon]